MTETHFITVSNIYTKSSESKTAQICIYDAYIKSARREELNNEYRYGYHIYHDCAELLDTADKNHLIVKVMVVPQVEGLKDNGIYC